MGYSVDFRDGRLNVRADDGRLVGAYWDASGPEAALWAARWDTQSHTFDSPEAAKQAIIDHAEANPRFRLVG